MYACLKKLTQKCEKVGCEIGEYQSFAEEVPICFIGGDEIFAGTPIMRTIVKFRGSPTIGMKMVSLTE